jgi:hypothetical protein
MAPDLPLIAARSASPGWATRAFEKSKTWFDTAHPALVGRLERMRARVASAQGQSSMEDALTAPFATPFLALIEAHRADLGLPPEGPVDAVGEGTLALYFYLRLQDDIVDEPAVFDPSFVYAAEVFAGASAQAFAIAAGGDPTFWALRRRILDDLAAVSAWEIDAYRREDPAHAGARAEEHAALLGAKLAPVAIPLAALASAAGKGGAEAWIGPFARSLGAALQITNDLLNARDDHAAGRLTPSLAALYSGGRVTPDSEAYRVWPALASDPALLRMTRAARAHLDAATFAARSAGASAVAEVAAAHGAALDEIAPRLLRLTLGVRP